jgi:diguanylate cyclase (GGDEF)-like protein
LSIGITCIESTTADWEALYSQADRAMYEAKRNGKNRFHVSEVQSVA